MELKDFCNEICSFSQRPSEIIWKGRGSACSDDYFKLHQFTVCTFVSEQGAGVTKLNFISLLML